MCADYVHSEMQVLQKALSNWDLSVTSITHPDKKHFAQNPNAAAGYICNLDAHWYTIRPVYGTWYNFNSLQPAPSPVGDAYLEAYLATLRSQQWTIYVVEGPLHPCKISNAVCVEMNRSGRVWTLEEVRSKRKPTAWIEDRSNTTKICKP